MAVALFSDKCLPILERIGCSQRWYFGTSQTPGTTQVPAAVMASLTLSLYTQWVLLMAQLYPHTLHPSGPGGNADPAAKVSGGAQVTSPITSQPFQKRIVRHSTRKSLWDHYFIPVFMQCFGLRSHTDHKVSSIRQMCPHQNILPRHHERP